MTAPWKVGDRVAVPQFRYHRKAYGSPKKVFRKDRLGTIERVGADPLGVGIRDVWVRMDGDRNPHRYSASVDRPPFRVLTLLEQIADAAREES